VVRVTRDRAGSGLHSYSHRLHSYSIRLSASDRYTSLLDLGSIFSELIGQPTPPEF
jgi:hypothetical protein